MGTPYFVFERAGSERLFDVMRQTGPRSCIDLLPSFKAKSMAERVAKGLNDAYSLGNREGHRRRRLKNFALRGARVF